MKTLVIAAHPDDEVLGAGGLISQTARTHEVGIGILGEGATSRTRDREQADSREVNRLEDDAKAAARIMGVHDIRFAGLPDNRFDTVALLDIVKTVEEWIDDFRPDRVLTHSPGDLNVDHGLTYRATLTALRPVQEHRVQELLSFYVPSATEWAHGTLNGSFEPNVFVCIDDTIDTKIEAMNAYGSEIRPAPHPRSSEALRSIAQYWGTHMGSKHAEPFHLIRSLR